MLKFILEVEDFKKQEEGVFIAGEKKDRKTVLFQTMAPQARLELATN